MASHGKIGSYADLYGKRLNDGRMRLWRPDLARPRILACTTILRLTRLRSDPSSFVGLYI